MKAYVVYQGIGWVGDWHAMLVREDGAVLADHVCSSPSYMFGDLWDRRQERKEKFPELKVEPNPMFWEEFQKNYPEVFAKAFKVKE